MLHSGKLFTVRNMTHMISISVLTWQKSVLLLMLLTSCSGCITYYVTPTPGVQCPGEPCYTLSEYVADQYFQNFTVNTTMEFLPGNHSLEQTISVTNLTWLTLHGNSSSLPEVTSRIICTWPAGFIFKNITELHISALGFLSCGHNDSAAVSMIFVQQSDISNCIFQNSLNNKEEEKGALCYPSPYNDDFRNNTRDQNATDEGGALYIDTSNLALTENFFWNNFAICGGALGVWKSNLIITGNSFQNNSRSSVFGVIGGALSASNSALTLTGNTFRNNCYGTNCLYAGALYVWLSFITLTENSFQSNSATDYGGAVIILSSTLTLSRNVFQRNMAGSYGALLVVNSTGTFRNNTFQQNFGLAFGGSFGMDSSILNLIENTFQFNSASAGGVLEVGSNNSLSLTGNTFLNNYAKDGGAIVVVSDGNILSLTENTSQSNSAMYSGGALSINSCACNLSITGNMFLNNSATSGGALIVNLGGAFVASSTVNLIRNTFWINSATEIGGALSLYAGNMTSTDNHFTNNFAQLGGAIIVVSNSRVRMYGKTYLETTQLSMVEALLLLVAN